MAAFEWHQVEVKEVESTATAKYSMAHLLVDIGTNN